MNAVHHIYNWLHRFRRWIISRLNGVPIDQTVLVIHKELVKPDGEWHHIAGTVWVKRDPDKDPLTVQHLAVYVAGHEMEVRKKRKK